MKIESYRNALSQWETGIFDAGDGVGLSWYRRNVGAPLSCLFVPGTFSPGYKFAPLFTQLALPVNILTVEWPGARNLTSPCLGHDLPFYTAKMLAVRRTLLPGSYIFGGHSLGGMACIDALRFKDPDLKGIISMEGWTSHTVCRGFKDRGETSKLNPAQTAISQALRADFLTGWTQRQQQEFATVWTRWNGWELLDNCKIPLLSIWGDRSFVPKPTRKDLLLPDNPMIELSFIADADHNYPISHPEKMTAIVNRFLQRHYA